MASVHQCFCCIFGVWFWVNAAIVLGSQGVLLNFVLHILGSGFGSVSAAIVLGLQDGALDGLLRYSKDSPQSPLYLLVCCFGVC
ncbi:hypothetical protein U1Q18_038523 [Sarracenia purpurea var. burkii]